MLFDKAGVGLSDPVPQVRNLDDRAAEIEAAMDAVGFSSAAILALSEGGPAAIVFAATRPQQTRALILSSTFAYVGSFGWDEAFSDQAELRARVLSELGEDYTPSVEQIARIQTFGRAVRSDWRSGAAIKLLIPSIRSTRQLGTDFEDRGIVELRGVPGRWQLLAVDHSRPRAGSVEAELASIPTPGPRTAMRRSDRAVEVVARRAPWMLRGMSRLTGSQITARNR